MENIFYIILFIHGLMFGSFSSVVIHRLKSGESGIMGGRSHCPKCNTGLKFYDLFPIFSWLSTFGKCRYCKSKISPIYPILELSTGLVFSLIGYFLIDFSLIASGSISEISTLIYWLIIGFITIIYIFYDILFLEIHEGVMLTGIVFAFLGLVSNSFFIPLLPTIQITNDIFLLEQIYSIILGILIIGALYLIMLKELKIIYDIIILILIIVSLVLFKDFFDINSFSNIPVLNGIIGALGIFLFFFLQIVLSGGKALGGGDLRIGIMIGLMLGISYSFAGMMITYLVGSIISIFIIILAKIKDRNKKMNTEVPFGPFLGLGFLICVFFLNDVTNIIERYFSTM